MSFYNDFRNTQSARTKRSIQSANSSHKDRIINIQKREKLKGLLIMKFMKKYGIDAYDQIIDREVSEFLKCESLNDNDLKTLDKRISRLLNERQHMNSLANQLNEENRLPEQNKKKLNEIENYQRTFSAHDKKRDIDGMSARSGYSKMSGGSKMSMAKPKEKPLCQDDLDLLSVKLEPIDRIDLGNTKDEWDAICKYNQKVYEQDKIKERLKDREVKSRTREDLNNQIKQKLVRLNEERLKNREYDSIMLNHIDALNKLEREKQERLRNQMIREKENRDKQRLDEKKRKRIETMKEKNYDKELRKDVLN